MHIHRTALFILIITVSGNESIARTVEHIQETGMQGKPGTEDGGNHHIIIESADRSYPQRRLYLLFGIGEFLTHFVRHDFADAFDVPAETHTVGLYLHIAYLRHVLVQD